MPIRSDTLDSFDDDEDGFNNEMDLDEDGFWSDFYYDWDGEDPFEEFGADYSDGD